jgi:hypothetical protein
MVHKAPKSATMDTGSDGRVLELVVVVLVAIAEIGYL